MNTDKNELDRLEAAACMITGLLGPFESVFICVHLWLIPVRLSSAAIRGQATDSPQHPADLGRRGQALLDGQAGPLPAVDHARGDGDLLEPADVGAGQDGQAELLLVGQQELGQDDAGPGSRSPGTRVAAAGDPGLSRPAGRAGLRARSDGAEHSAQSLRTRRWATTARRPLRIA